MKSSLSRRKQKKISGLEAGVDTREDNYVNNSERKIETQKGRTEHVILSRDVV
jgi:hypothetical protein